MARGKKPVTKIDGAKKFAERMGYRWTDNADPDLPFDALIFKEDSIRAITVREVRTRIGPDVFYEKKFPDEVAGLRSLPLPPYVFCELWVKTRGERTYRRLHVTPVSVGEIEWWGPDGYTNPHARRDDGKKPVPTGKFVVKKSPAGRPDRPPAAPPVRVSEK